MNSPIWSSIRSDQRTLIYCLKYALEMAELPPSSRIVLNAILLRAWDFGTTNASTQQLAAEVNMTEQQVEAAIGDLEGRFLLWVRRAADGSRYFQFPFEGEARYQLVGWADYAEIPARRLDLG